MNRLSIFCAAAVLIAVVGLPTVQAQPQGQDFKAADRDGDGALSADEARAALQAKFLALDLNHDGMVSEEEFVTARMAQFGKADTNGDGRLVRSELLQFIRDRHTD